MGSGLQSARFHTTVAEPGQIPPADKAEVAFAGRSNAGKSSAINRLCQRNRLAFASKTPGRTQALNYFALGPEDEPAHSFLVDTPGYGYAAVPLELKRGWQGLAGWYLQERTTLAGVVLMVDCRRQLTEKDIALLRWIPESVHRLILITKADKLNRQAQQQTLAIIQQQYMEAMPDIAASFLLFSSTKGLGVDAARGLIEEWLGIEQASRADKAANKASRKLAYEEMMAAKKNPAADAPGYKPVNRGARSGRRSGR